MADQPVSVAADAPLAKLDHSILGAVRRLADDECAKKVRDLTAKGAHAGCADPADYAYQPLHIAAIRDLAETIDALIAAGADVNARARHGQAPLHLAAAAGSDAAVARLLAAGAALDARDLSGWTPLHQAAHYGQEGAMRALLAAGASPCKKTVEGFAARGLLENLDEPAAREALLALLAPFEQSAAGEQAGDDDSAAAKDPWEAAAAVGERLLAAGGNASGGTGVGAIQPRGAPSDAISRNGSNADDASQDEELRSALAAMEGGGLAAGLRTLGASGNKALAAVAKEALAAAEAEGSLDPKGPYGVAPELLFKLAQGAAAHGPVTRAGEAAGAGPAARGDMAGGGDVTMAVEAADDVTMAVEAAGVAEDETEARRARLRRAFGIPDDLDVGALRARFTEADGPASKTPALRLGGGPIGGAEADLVAQRTPLEGTAGIGVTFSVDVGGRYFVRALAPGGPAARSGGVQPGDILEAVDGRAVHAEHTEPARLARLVIGGDGSAVSLTLRTPDGLPERLAGERPDFMAAVAESLREGNGSNGGGRRAAAERAALHEQVGVAEGVALGCRVVELRRSTPVGGGFGIRQGIGAISACGAEGGHGEAPGARAGGADASAWARLPGLGEEVPRGEAQGALTEGELRMQATMREVREKAEAAARKRLPDKPPPGWEPTEELETLGGRLRPGAHLAQFVAGEGRAVAAGAQAAMQDASDEM